MKAFGGAYNSAFLKVRKWSVLCLATVGTVLLACRSENARVQISPYPPSTVVKRIVWEFNNLIRVAPGSDLWPTTWGGDDNIYTSWGDGGGFGGTNRRGRVSIGFARISGDPGNFQARNVWGGWGSENEAQFKGKSAGILSIHGVLYAWLNTQNGNPPDYKLAWSSDLGASWQVSNWVFPKAGSFFPSTFLNFGRDYSGARDTYVYSYGARWTEAQGPENHVYLARVNIREIRKREAYEFFAGLNAKQIPMWTPEVAQRRPVFTDPNGVGNTGLANVIFNPGINRYIMAVAHRPPHGDYVSATRGRLGIFDAPEPWGPWTTIAYYTNWGGFGDGGETLGYHFPTKWISADGTTMWMIFSSTGILDSFNLVKVVMTRN